MTSATIDLQMSCFRLPDGLETPVVVIDLDIVERNLVTMATALAARGVALRPHAKTHKSVEIARRQLAAGAAGITVGTIGEAEVMASGGVDDLFIAYPVWADATRAARLRSLHQRVALTVGIDSVAGARQLGAALAGVGRPLPVLIELDSGERRTGVVGAAAVVEVASAAARAGLEVRGAFTHGGHAYRDPTARASAARDECDVLAMARDALLAAGFATDVLSAGSTPTATLSAEGVVTEERPGTYVFGDRQQIALGSIPADAAGLVVAATVVSAAVPGQVVIDAGAKILARDRPDFLDGLGIVPALGGAVVERAYDYHGVVRLPEGTATPEIGTVVAVIPNHVCPVVNLVDAMHVVVDGRSVATWPVDARGLNG